MLLLTKADLQFEKVVFRFQTYDQNEMCRECHAHKLVLSKIYTDIGPNARWRPHKRTEAEYLARMLKLGHLSKLTSIPGWLGT